MVVIVSLKIKIMRTSMGIELHYSIVSFNGEVSKSYMIRVTIPVIDVSKFVFISVLSMIDIDASFALSLLACD